jgi:preprotein translocase subunit SecF
MSMYSFGNDLYTGRKSFDFVGKRKIWFSIAIVAIIASVCLVIFKGLNLGIEFTGGSQFTISSTQTTDQSLASDIMSKDLGDSAARVTQVGSSTIRVQTSAQGISNEDTEKVRQALADAYDVDVAKVTSTFIGPSWGADIFSKAIRGFIVFLVLVAVGLSLYFRSWRNAAGAILALFHDLIVTVGIYCLFGFEVTPSTVIGLLTILGYSLYDTIVVFDKVRENTTKLLAQRSYTFAESTNLAVNQTLIRSINTSVTSILPVASILFIGVLVLGAGTLRDLALVMFVGLLLSTMSSLFIATPLAVQLAELDPALKKHTALVLELRTQRKAAREARIAAGETDLGADDEADNLEAAHGVIREVGHHQGIAAQPKRKNRRKR